MTITRISPEEAHALMTREGYVYVDVRSTREFRAGHPEGAVNVPIAEVGPFGIAPNPDFLRTMEARYAKDARLIVGCRSGPRSLQAAHVLRAAGFTTVVDQRAGFEGTLREPGWQPLGLPVATENGDAA